MKLHRPLAGIVVLGFLAGLVPRVAHGGQEQPLVTLSISAAEVELGEPFFAYIEVSTARGTEVSLPRDLVLGAAFEETGRKLTATHPGDRDLFTFELKLMAFDLGEQEIPEIPIIYAGEGGAQEVRTAVSRITVRSILGKGDVALRDVAPVVVIRRDMRRLYWSVGIVASVLLGAILALALSRRAPKVKFKPVEPRVPPLSRARQRFEAVERKLSAQQDGGCRDAYVELSEVVREYLGDSFAVPALDATTAEIAASLADIDVISESRTDLVDWLKSSDLVKFAGYRASVEEARAALFQARGWIEQTERARKRAERSSHAQ